MTVIYKCDICKKTESNDLEIRVYFIDHIRFDICKKCQIEVANAIGELAKNE